MKRRKPHELEPAEARSTVNLGQAMAEARQRQEEKAQRRKEKAQLVGYGRAVRGEDDPFGEARKERRISTAQPWTAVKPGKPFGGRGGKKKAQDKGYVDQEVKPWKPRPVRGLEYGIEEEPKPEDIKPKRKRPGPSPIARAVALLARREHSKVELVRKLVEREVPEEEAQAAVDRLEELGLQSDTRFLESKVRQRINDGHGPNRAQFDLARHGLAEQKVAEEIDAKDSKWWRAAYDLVERRFGAGKLDLKTQQKAMGLLLRRGFTYDQAQGVLRRPRQDWELDSKEQP